MKYYLIYDQVAEQLKLEGVELMLFSALAFMTNKYPYTKGARHLSQETHCGSKDTVLRTLDKLAAKGLVVRDRNGITLSVSARQAVQNATPSAQTETPAAQNETVAAQNATNQKERSKENINNIINNTNQIQQEEEEGSTDKSGFSYDIDFISFWDNFNVNSAYSNRKKACYLLWCRMPDEWKALAEEAAPYHAADANPYFWLKNEQFLTDLEAHYDNMSADGSKGNIQEMPHEEPHWLSYAEQDECRAKKIIMVNCKKPGEELYGTLKEEEWKIYQFPLAENAYACNRILD